jgi:stage II sporulation protein D
MTRPHRILAAAFVSFVAMGASSQPPVSRPATLRVGMWTLWHDREIALTPTASTMLQTCEPCEKRVLHNAATVGANQHGGLTLLVGEHTMQLRAIRLSGGVTLTAHSESATLRDRVTITARGGTLVIAVTMPVERYVEHVVASESGLEDSTESLKALAIVVRTYALHESHGHPDYDLCDSTHCQLLHWHSDPHRSPAAHEQTLATAGETLWFHGRRAIAYFSKDCGGRTASLAEIWPHVDSAPYLDSHADKFCTKESGGWSSELTRTELTSALASRGLAAPGWQHLSVEHRGESGRVVTLRLDSITIHAEDFRIAVGESLGWNKVPSTWFEVSQQGDRFFFHGRGTGHGVGLCQKGAAAMAAQGRSSHEILTQYFSGAATADESTGKSWQSLARAGFTLETQNASDASFLADLARARAEASERSGFNPSQPFTVRAFPSTSAFRDATLAPGWTAAFTEGDWIATQPLATLAARHLLLPTMRHEFLHALIEHEAGPRAPLWLREGLVELWSTDPDAWTNLRPRTPVMALDAVDAALLHSTTEAQSRAAHRDAAIHVLRLLDGYGRAQALEWIRSGVPADALARIGQR